VATINRISKAVAPAGGRKLKHEFSHFLKIST